MFERSQIEKLLKLNGVEPSSDDDEIKSVLISAKWHKDDVETALVVLRENKKDHKKHVNSLHKVFRTDQRLRPETVSALLGIDVNYKGGSISEIHRRKQFLSTGQLIQIAMVSLAFSMILIFGSMYFMQIGIFHQTHKQVQR